MPQSKNLAAPMGGAMTVAAYSLRYTFMPGVPVKTSKNTKGPASTTYSVCAVVCRSLKRRRDGYGPEHAGERTVRERAAEYKGRGLLGRPVLAEQKSTL